MLKKTKEFCDSFLEKGLPGFDLMVCVDGECVFRHMGGYSDLEKQIPMMGNERYNIYSCSKVITCVAAMQLWERGVFSLEDKLGDYLPEFQNMTVYTAEGIKEAENSILIKHLFEMTAGFSYNVFSPQIQRCKEVTKGSCATRETMKYLAQEPLLFEPGTRWEYSLCHDVLAAFVEVVSGEKFEFYVKKHIFDVLGMKDSTFMLPEEEIETITQQYRFQDGKPVNVGKHICGYKLGHDYASGGAGCISTVEDYMKFLEGLRNCVLLKPETVQFMRTNRLSASQASTYSWGANYGYGLGVRCPKENGRFDDFGWGGAATAYLAIDMDKKISVYFGAHFLSSPIQGLRSMIYRFVYAELFDEGSLADIYKELEELHHYQLTY